MRRAQCGALGAGNGNELCSASCTCACPSALTFAANDVPLTIAPERPSIRCFNGSAWAMPLRKLGACAAS